MENVLFWGSLAVKSCLSGGIDLVTLLHGMTASKICKVLP